MGDKNNNDLIRAMIDPIKDKKLEGYDENSGLEEATISAKIKLDKVRRLFKIYSTQIKRKLISNRKMRISFFITINFLMVGLLTCLLILVFLHPNVEHLLITVPSIVGTFLTLPLIICNYLFPKNEKEDENIMKLMNLGE